MGRLFGTDGIRGIANTELGCDKAMIIGRAAATVLSKGLEKRPTIIIGTDTRASSEMLGAAVSAGICSAGANVIMPNLSPTAVRSKYELYNNKLHTGAESAENIEILNNNLLEIGFQVEITRGDVKGE